jgi:aspartate-semialdehyde dehydrogenase
MSERAPVVAVVGATGAAGTTVLRVLEDRVFPMSEFRALASARSAGTTVRFRDRDVEVREVTDQELAGADLVFFAAGSGVAKRFAPVVAAGGGIAIDKSSAYRMDPDVPLIVPEVNADQIPKHHGILSNPNCITIPLTVTLAPLHKEAQLKQVTVATYQAASGGGRDLANELASQERADAAGKTPARVVYPHVLHGNVVPGGWPMRGEHTEEACKIVEESRRVLDVSDLPMSVMTVRVPVPVGHSAAVFVQFEKKLEAEVARRILEDAPGILVVDDPQTQQYPTPRAAAGGDGVHVGCIQNDPGHENGSILFFAVDNLRKGAGTNAVQVAELAWESRVLS